MRRLLLVVLSACSLDESGLGALADGGSDVVVKDVTSLDVVTNDVSADAIVDAPPDAPPPPCNPTAAFGNLNAVAGGVNTPAYESNPMLSPNELLVFFTRDVGSNELALMYATRSSTSQPFGPATQLSLSTKTSIDTSSWVDDKMTTMLFASVRAPDKHLHLYSATGNGQPDGWTNITKLVTLDALEPLADLHPWLAPVTGEVFFASDRAGSLDIYWAASTTTAPVPYAPLSTSQFAESHPVLSADALTIFFARDDAQAKSHVFTATRTTTASLFANVVQLGEFDQSMTQSAPGWISADGCRMYFTTDRSGGGDIWIATRGS